MPNWACEIHTNNNPTGVCVCGFLVIDCQFLCVFVCGSGDRCDANRPRVARFAVQPGQDDQRQALLRVQGALSRSEAAGSGHVSARVEVSGKSRRTRVFLIDDTR